jgi:cytidylate kinase
MYREVEIEAINRNVNLEDENEFGFVKDIEVLYKDGKTYLNGKDVSKEIRTSEISSGASLVSKYKIVRDRMLIFQRKSAENGKVIMDGRDIGTIVLPNADLKIFLTAKADERARRRLKENKEKGIESDFETILHEIKVRDYNDSHRAIAPLKIAEGAILVDTTHMTIDEVIDHIIKLINEKRNKNMANKESSFEELLNSYDIKQNIKPGDIVEGTVVQIRDDKTLLLDIHSFTEGTLHLNYYTKDPSILSFKGLVKIGDKINCKVTKVEYGQGRLDHSLIMLSRLDEEKNETFKKIIDAKEQNTILNVYVAKEVNSGYLCSYAGIELFMPKSQAIKDLAVKSNVDVKVIEVEESRRRAVVSAKAVEHEKYIEERDKALEKINVGDVLEGTITKVEKYIAFVKISNIVGVIKARDVCHEFVDITTVLHVGDPVKVQVLSKENGKLVLSRKALIKTAYQLFKENHKVSDKIKGKVTNKQPGYLLLEIAPNLKGLLHQSEYSWNPNDNYNNNVVIGDEVEVAIISMNDEKENIRLSRKALMDNPWDKVETSIGEVLDVKIKEINKLGLVVEALGVDGIIPASETNVEDTRRDLAEYFAVGDEAKAVVVEFNKKEWKLKLSIRKFANKEERKKIEKYLQNEDVTSSIGDQFEDVLKK